MEMCRRFAPLALGLTFSASALANGPPPVPPPVDPAHAALLSQARLWVARDRSDLSIAALERLFAIAPGHPDGLGQLALIHLQMKRHDEARKVLHALQSAKPDHPDIARIHTLLRLEGPDKPRLQQARRLAQEDKSAEALSLLNELYPNGPPTGDLAMEYYSLFPYNEHGWKSALAGIRRVVAEHPDNQRYRLVLAEHITRRVPNDPEALKTIAALTKVPQLQRQARSAWRRAMLRLDAQPSNLALIEEYLKLETVRDSAVIEHLATLRSEIERLATERAEAEQLARLKAESERQEQEQARQRQLEEEALQAEARTAQAQAQEAVDPELADADIPAVPNPAPASADMPAAPEPTELQATAGDEQHVTHQSVPDISLVAKVDGLAFLDKGDLVQAQKHLSAANRDHPNDPEILRALGLLRMKQGEHGKAQQHFHQALRHGGDTKQLGGLLRTARFWGLIQKASTAADLNEFDRAEAILLDARRINATEPVLMMALGRLYSQQKRDHEAEIQFREVMRTEPKNIDAARELAKLHLRHGRTGAVAQLLASLDVTARQELEQALRPARAQALKSMAEALISNNQPAQAVTVLEEASRYDQNDPWLRFSLAKLYAGRGETDRALSLFIDLLARRPDDADTHYAHALLLARVDRPVAALTSLEKIRTPDRTEGMIAMQRRIWTQVTVKQATQLAAGGKLDTAESILGYAQEAIEADPVLSLDVAAAWIGMGKLQQAESILFALVDSQSPDADWSVRHARLLGESGREDLALPLLAQMGSQEQLPERKSAIADATIALSIRKANALLELGQFAQADELLAERRKSYPESDILLMAHARILREAGLKDQAVQSYRELLGRRKEDRDAAIGLVSVLLDQGRRSEARSVINTHLSDLSTMTPDQMSESCTALITMGDYTEAKEVNAAALARFPDHAKALEQASLLAQREGRIDDAVGYQRRALARRKPPGEAALSTIRVAPERAGNFLPGLEIVPDSQQRNDERTQAERIFDRVSGGVNGADLLQTPAHMPYSDIDASAREYVLALAGSAIPVDAILAPSGALPALYPDGQAGWDVARADTGGAHDGVGRVEMQGSALEIIPGTAGSIEQDTDFSYAYRRLADLLDERSSWGTGAVDIRTRDGSAGRSEFLAVEAPLEWKQKRTPFGRWTYRADLVKVDADKLDLADAGNVFGSTLLCQPVCNTGVFRQEERGVALNVSLDRNSTRYDIGTTPLGFPVKTVIGGILHVGRIGPFGYSANLSRRPVSSSLLSYAGTRDPRTGRVWGGVHATGIRLGLSADRGGTVGGWSSLGWHRIDGKNVQSNNRTQLMAGAIYRILNEDNRAMHVGLTGMLWRMQRNVGEYTFGHGGYFSPGRFASLSIPVTYAQRFARFSYLVRAAISRTRTRTPSAAYFPTDGALQNEAERLAGTTSVSPFYGSDQSGGFGRSLAFAWEYQANLQTFIGGRFELDRSREYAPNRYTVYLRHAFGTPPASPVPLMPEAILPISQF